MNFYSFHIGDFNRATRHLTRLERGIYRDLIDLYYDTEAPLVDDLKLLCRKIIATKKEEKNIVAQLLEEFFFLTDEGWAHSRCDFEIAKYKANNSKKAMAGKASAEARRVKKIKNNFNTCSTHVQQMLNSVATEAQHNLTNQEPITNNHKKEEKNLIKKEKEKKESEPKKTATTIPKDWQPTEEDIEFCRREKPTLDWRRVQTSFVSYYLSQTGRNAKSSDWSARWRYWVSNARVEKQSESERRKVWVDGLTGSNRPVEKLIGGGDCDEF